MNADADDPDFVDRLTNLTGMNKDAVEELLDRLSADDLLTLSDAVAQDDEATAREVIGTVDADEEVNPLFHGKDVDAPARPHKRQRRGHGSIGIGDEVLVQGDDGDFEATLIRAGGPHNTVMVKYQGKKHMVDRHKVHPVEKLDEMVLGMTGMPELQRIQQLAGIAQSATPSAEAAPVVTVEQPDAAPEADCPRVLADNALNALEAALPQITLADLKTIRQRIVAIQTKMNEGFDMRKRKA